MGDLRYNTAWREMAAAVYERPRDGKIMGSYDIDVTDAMAWLDELRAEGHRVTPLHLVIAAMARCLAAVPELNCYARWGKVYYRGNVTVSSVVSVKGRDMGVVRVVDADKKTITEIAAEMQARVEATRQGEDQTTGGSKNALAKIPWPFRRWVFQLLRWLIFEMGVSIPGTGLSVDAFGSVLITNVGSLGIHYAFPALLPAANLSFVVAMGKVVEVPRYRDGQLVPRKLLPFGASFDHRVVDGAYIGRLQALFEHLLTHPRELGEPPKAS